MQLSNVTVYNNSAYGIVIISSAFVSGTSYKISLSFVRFMRNVNALNIVASGPKENFEVAINNSIVTSNTGNDANTDFSEAKRLGVIRIAVSSCYTSVIIANSQFYSNFNGAIGIRTLPVNCVIPGSASTLFTNVTIYNTTTTNDIIYAGIARVSIIYSNLMLSTTTFTNVNFTSNNYSKYNGEVLYIENIINTMDYHPLDRIFVHTSLMDCTFYCNSASDHVVFLNTIADTNDNYPAYYDYNKISKSIFHGNFGGESIVCIHQLINSPFPSGVITELDNSTFSNNEGTSLYLLIIGLQLSGNILFINNTANSGAAEEVHSISSDSTDVWFINNTAVQRGGALYI